MKRFCMIFLLFLGLTPVIKAVDKEDSLNYYYQRLSVAYESGDAKDACLCFKNTLRLYKEIRGNISRDTVYAGIESHYARLCYQLGDYETAIRLLTEMSNIYKVYGTNNPHYATSLEDLSVCFANIWNYKKAIENYTIVLEIKKRTLGEINPDYAASLNVFANYYSDLGNYTKAIELGTQALGIERETLGEDHPDYAISLGNLAGYYSNLGDYVKAVEFGTLSMEILKKTLGEDHPEYAISLGNLAGYYSNHGDYVKAIELGTLTMEILKKTLGENHPHYATSLSKLAGYYSNLGDNVKAIELGTQALEIIKNTLGGNHPHYATSLGNLAFYYSHLGDYSKAIELGTQALEIKRKSLGDDHPHYATSLSELAGYYSDLGDYVKAVEFGTLAMEIRRKTLGKKHPEFATSLVNLAGYYSNLGDYVKAVEFGTLAMEIHRKTLGEDHPHYATSLGQLANFYSKLGDYIKAVELRTQALEIYRKTIGKDNPHYATSLGQLAGYYSSLGDYVKAVELGTLDLEITRKIFGDDHPEYATSLVNLAVFYSKLENYVKAIELGTQGMEIRRKTLGKKHPEFATSLVNLAGYYSDLGDYAKAVEFGTLSMEILKKTLGEDHPHYATSLSKLAGYYSKLGDYAKAIELVTQALEILKKILGENHPEYATSLNNLAYYYLFSGHSASAIPLLKEYTTIVRKFILNTFSGLTTNERQLYWNKYSSVLNQWIPMVIIYSGEENAASMLYDHTALFAKGLLLSTELEMAKIIKESGDDEALHMYSELYHNRQLLNIQYSKPIAERMVDCDSLEEASSKLERQIVTRVKEFGDYTCNLSITWRDVQCKLNDDEIAIEFLSFPKNDSIDIYVALTLCKNDTAPILTPLFITDLMLEESEGSDFLYQDSIADFMIWAPLTSRLEGKTRVYFSASGMLHSIGIEYLPSMDGKECYRLSSTRELAIERSETPSNGAVVYGGIKYDSDVSQMGTPRKDGSFLAHRGFNPDSVTLRGNWEYLTGSLDEANEVDSILEIKNVDVKKVTGLDATETSFKDLSGQRKRILHIATHGFFYNDSTAHRYNERERLGFLQLDNDRPRYVEDKAMTRSGLLFVGAQNTFDGVKIPDGVDDGVLTAQEVAQLDLRGLDLLVLSACQTGLGEITSDGVFGLQRGFKKAGAKSILMSLWNVNDNATHLLMTEFYRGWTSGMTKYAALRQAQSAVKEKYPDPKYWAAFILLDALE